MGVDYRDGKGLHKDDFVYLVKGHVKNGYKVRS